MLVYAVVDTRASADHPLGHAVETFLRREDAERFVEEVRGDDPELASYLRFGERELRARGGRAEQTPRCWPPTKRGSNVPRVDHCQLHPRARFAAAQATAFPRRTRPYDPGCRIVSRDSSSLWESPSVRVGAARALAPAVILAVFGLLVTGVIPASIWTWVATGVLLAALFAATAISEVDRESLTPLGVLVATLLGVGFVLFYYLGCRLLATRADWGLAVIDAFLFAATVGLGLALGMPRFRRNLMGVPGDDNPTHVGMLGPFGLLAVLFAIMTSVFASVTLIAADKDLISLTAGGVDQPSFEKIAQLYIWQFCKSVPLLDINETLRWKPPFIYTGTDTGTLVLLYKIAVIIPIIGAFLDFWSKQVEDSERSERPGGS